MSFLYKTQDAVTKLIRRQLIYHSGLTNKEDIQLQAVLSLQKSITVVMIYYSLIGRANKLFIEDKQY